MRYPNNRFIAARVLRYIGRDIMQIKISKLSYPYAFLVVKSLIQQEVLPKRPTSLVEDQASHLDALSTRGV